jgi:hypothetical protein
MTDHNTKTRRPTRSRRAAIAGPAIAGLVAATAATFGAAGPSTASTGITSTTTSTAAKPVAAVSTSAANCDRAPWGLRVQGAPPNFSGGDRGGDYLWHDTTGFHLRVTHRSDDRVVYSGVISSPVPMSMDPVRLEQGDVAKLSTDRRTLVFAFANHGHVDGVNFHTACAAHLTVSRLNAGSARLSPARVYLGALSRHPHHVPFTVSRRVP